MSKRYRYTVIGSRFFPLDMLRYDAAWPARQEDVATIEQLDERDVQLIGTQEPTVSRWLSFGWQVGPVEVLR